MMDSHQPTVWQPSPIPAFSFLLSGWTKEQLVIGAAPYGAAVAEFLKYLIKLDAYQPWVWLTPTALILVGAFLGQRILNRQNRQRQAELEKLRPARIEAYFVKLAVNQDRIQTGEDQGWLWFEGPLLRFSGLRCEIRLTANKASDIREHLRSEKGTWEVEVREPGVTLEFFMEPKGEVEVPPQRVASIFKRWEGLKGQVTRSVCIYPEDVQLEYWQTQNVNRHMLLWSLAFQSGIALWMLMNCLEDSLGKGASMRDFLLHWGVFAIIGLGVAFFVWCGASSRAQKFRERRLRLAGNR